MEYMKNTPAAILRHRTLFLSLFLALLVFGLYWNSLGNAFVWDDHYAVTKNTYVQNPEHFLDLFSGNTYSGSGSIGSNWRPAMLTIFSSLWHFFGAWPPAFHFASIAFHAMNAILVFCLFNLIFKRRYLAFFAALLFAVHPLQTQAIDYIAGFGDPLAAFFMLLGTLSYVKTQGGGKNKNAYLWGTALMQILALMSKEYAVMMPGLLFLADFFVRGKEANVTEKIYASIKKLLPFLLVFTCYVAARMTALDFLKGLVESSFSTPLYERMLIFFSVFPEYLRLVFVPIRLHMEHSVYWVYSAFQPNVITGISLVFLFSTAIFTQYKKRPEVSFGLAWFLVAFSPNMNIFMPTTALFGEHWLYLSLPGLFIALFAAADEFLRNTKYFTLAFILFFIWTLWLGTVVIARNQEWSTPVSILSQTLREEPRHSRVMAILANEYRDRGEYEKAEKLYTDSIHIDPRNDLVYAERAKLYKLLGREADRLRDMETSVKIKPGLSMAWNDLFEYYALKKEYEKMETILIARIQTTKDPVEALGLSLKLVNVAVAKKDRALAHEYLKLADQCEKRLAHDRTSSFNAWISKAFP